MDNKDQLKLNIQSALKKLGVDLELSAIVIDNSKSAEQVGSALAGGVVAVLPVLVVYLIAQNKIIEGMSSAGIKG